MTEKEKLELRYLDDERVEGLEAIRKVIDPTMTEKTFNRHWRRKVDPILMEHKYWYRERRMGRPGHKYFTFRRLIYGVMLAERKI